MSLFCTVFSTFVMILVVFCGLLALGIFLNGLILGAYVIGRAIAKMVKHVRL